MNLFFILISICIIGLLYLLYLLVFSRKPNSRAHIPKILSKNNMCLFFSSLENDISYRRRRNITRELEKYRINFKMLPGVQNIPQIEIRYFYLLNMLNSFKKSDYEYAIICDDDFIPCSNFWNELTKTIVSTGAEEVLITHGHEECLKHWCKTNKIFARNLSLENYEKVN